MIFKNYRNEGGNQPQENQDHDKAMTDKNKQTSNNVRQLPTQHQNQILSALDTLGAKLVRSETERETMRKLLNEAMDAQERLENQLERSQLDLQNRLSGLETSGRVGEEVDAKFEEQAKAIAESKSDLESQKDKQIRLEDKLRDSQQTVAKLQRRIDTQEQKRARLQRRIERVENIAAEAKEALEAKALVLLSDRSHAATSLLPYIDATAPMQAIENLHKDGVEVEDITHASKNRSWMGGAAIAALVVLALGIGWLGGKTSMQSDKAFAVLQDGTLAQIDIRNGTAQPIQFNAQPKTFSVSSSPDLSPVSDYGNADIDSEIANLETDWIVEDFLVQAREEMASETAPQEQVVINMERDPNLPEAVKQIEDKAFGGIPEAQHDLAALYTAGQQAGVTQDYARAAYWFKQAADQGIDNAAYNLGVLYHQGLGVDQDTAKAMDWYARAAQLGHPEAQYNLGIAYIEGIGTPYNPNMAAAFFQQAALGGIVEAAYNLGLILENGLLGEVRPIDALRWYRGAAEKGSIEAETALANLSDRLDVPRDQAGLLDDGESLASYMAHPDQIEPAAGDAADENMMSETTYGQERDAPENADLGALVPSRAQIVIAQIQEQLRKMRYYNGQQDGIADNETVEAIKSYQIYAGLPIDGQPTEELLSYMLAQGTL